MAKEKAIKTPERMWELFQGYKKKTKKNPFLQHDFVGKDGDSVNRKRERCLTMVGFECYVLEHTDLTYPDLTHYFEGKDNYKIFVPISSRIRAEIKKDQTEGGMAMIYSQSLTARLNGYGDKTEHTVIEQPLFPEDDSSKK